jgi:DNA mismatch repair protein MutS
LGNQDEKEGAGGRGLTPIMAQYAGLKAEHPDALLFFRLGDFYELFGPDAQIAASILDIALTKRYKNTPDEVVMCGVPAHASQAYIARLVKQGFCVAIAEQISNAPPYASALEPSDSGASAVDSSAGAQDPRPAQPWDQASDQAGAQPSTQPSTQPSSQTSAGGVAIGEGSVLESLPGLDPTTLDSPCLDSLDSAGDQSSPTAQVFSDLEKRSQAAAHPTSAHPAPVYPTAAHPTSAHPADQSPAQPSSALNSAQPVRRPPASKRPASQAGKGPMARAVVQVITPGTVMDEGLIEARQHNFLLALVADPQHNEHPGTGDSSTGDSSNGQLNTGHPNNKHPNSQGLQAPWAHAGQMPLADRFKADCPGQDEVAGVFGDGPGQEGGQDRFGASQGEEGCSPLNLGLRGGLAAAFVDISTGDFFVQTVPFAALPELIERIQPQEILVPSPLAACSDFQAAVGKLARLVRPMAPSRFDLGDMRLASFFNVQTVTSFGSFSPKEIAAAGAVLDYVLVTQKRDVLMVSRPRRLKAGDFLEMDSFTRRSLELTQTLSGQHQGTLLQAIDRTMTPMGARLLAMRLSNPLCQLDPLEQRLDSVAYFVDNSLARSGVRQALGHMGDLERALTRCVAGRALPRDLSLLRGGLLLFPVVADSLLRGATVSQAASAHSTGLNSTGLNAKEALPSELAQQLKALSSHQALTKRLEASLAAQLPAHFRDGGVIASGFDATLDRLRDLRDNSEHLINELQERYIRETKIATLRIKHNAIIGYYIEVSSAAAAKVPFAFTLRQSLVSGCRYVTDELTELEKHLTAAQDESQALETVLVQDLLLAITQARHQLKAALGALAILDVSAGLAELAVQQHYTRPRLSGFHMTDPQMPGRQDPQRQSPHFYVQGGRHPVVQQLAIKPFVKNGCSLGTFQPARSDGAPPSVQELGLSQLDVPGADREASGREASGLEGFGLTQGPSHPSIGLQTNNGSQPHFPLSDPLMWILTGPNMAGKSTFLRQNALIVLMAHMGSFVPADFASMTLSDRLFSRVGASDDLARGQSTFMIEMVETATILNQATCHSFVILDEVGRGTATYDGLALAWAIVEYLVQHVQCRALFATHYHELRLLQGRLPVAFYTLRITQWQRDVVFFHEVVQGLAQGSFGLHVARLAGVPESVLGRAQHILSGLEGVQPQVEAALTARLP